MSEINRLARIVHELAGKVRDLEEESRLGHSSMVGSIGQYDSTGQLVARYGAQYDGTHGTVAFDGPVPPTPTGVTIQTALGGVIVHVPGTWEAPAVVAPLDWARFEVEVSADTGFSGTVYRTGITSAGGGDVNVPWAPVGTPLYARVRSKTVPGRVSPWSAVAGPVSSGAVGLGDLGFNMADYSGGTTVHYGPTEPAAEDIGGEGDLWLKELSAGPPPEYETRRWTGAVWQPLVDQGVTEALAAAVAAQTAADSKAKIFTQTSQPAWTGVDGSAIWFDTDDGNRQRVWNGTTFVDRRLGTGAFQPNSIVAKDVMATGTITAALFEAVMILVTVILTADPSGPHVRIDSNGLVSYAVNPDGQVVATSRFGGPGADRMLITNPDTGEAVANLSEDGALSVQSAVVSGDLIVKGNTLDYLLGQRAGRCVAWGVSTASTPGVTTSRGYFDVEFLAVPGRRYRLHTSTLNLTTSTTATYAFAQLRARKSADGAPTVSTGIPVVTANGSVNIVGGVAPITLNRAMNFEDFFPAGAAPTAPTLVRVLLCYGVNSGGGSVAIFSNTSYPIQLDIDEVGPSRQPTLNNNDGGGGGTTVAVTTQQLDFASTWAANWQSTSTAPRTGSSELIQGYTPYYPGPGAGVGQFGFGDLTGVLAGATINWMAVYVYATHWHYDSGGTALLGAHPYLNPPGSRPADWQLNLAQVGYSGKSGGQWIYIPSTWFAGFVSGANRGFTLGDLASTASQYYGRFAADPNDTRRPVLRINFTK